MHHDDQYPELTAEGAEVKPIPGIAGDDVVHQFARGMHSLCGLEIVAGVNGTRKTADITCPECLLVRNQIELGYTVFKLHPKPGDIIVIPLGPRSQVTREVIDQAIEITDKVRAEYPEVSFFLLPDGENVKHLSEDDMNAMGWHRGKKTIGKVKHHSFKNGSLQTK